MPSAAQQQLRYLETDLVHLKTSKRPMVVSFKRIPKGKKFSHKFIAIPPSNGVTCQRTGSFSVLEKSYMRSSMLPLPIQPIPSMSLQSSLESTRLLLAPTSAPTTTTTTTKTNGDNLINYGTVALQMNGSNVSLADNDDDCKRNSRHSAKSPILLLHRSHTDINKNHRSQKHLHEDFGANDFRLFDTINYPHLYNKIELPKPTEYPLTDFRKYNSTERKRSGPYADYTVSNINYTTGTYRSPYDSPELSASSKQLEENLQQILEGLVLYPKTDGTRSKQTGKIIRLRTSHSKIIRKCKSVPSLSHLFSHQRQHRDSTSSSSGSGGCGGGGVSSVGVGQSSKRGRYVVHCDDEIKEHVTDDIVVPGDDV